MRVKQRQFASAQVTSLPERATFKFLQEKTVRRDKVPEASELWQNQRFYISYIILYIIYTSSIFFLYFTMEKFKCMQNAKTNTVYPRSTQLQQFSIYGQSCYIYIPSHFFSFDKQISESHNFSCILVLYFLQPSQYLINSYLK